MMEIVRRQDPSLVIQTTTHPSSPMILTPTQTTKTDINKRARYFVYLLFLTVQCTKRYVSVILHYWLLSIKYTLQNCVILEFALLCFIR